MSSLPLIIAGAAAALLLGGKKKGKKKSAVETAPDNLSPDGLPPPPPMMDTDMDHGAGPQEEFGTVANGVRKDRRGWVPWRVYRDSDGYHAQTMVTDSKFAPVAEEIGIGASVSAAKKLLRDNFNELLLKKYPKEKVKNDPADVFRASVIKSK